MARDYYELKFLSRDVDVSPIVPALQSFFDDVLTTTVSELNFKTIVDGLGSVLYQYPFNVPAYYALILRSLTVLEGLALYTDPNFKVLAASYPYFAKRLLTDQNPYLRNALIELLFQNGTFRWNRLENLLTQGRKDSDFQANEVVQPIVELLLAQEGDELQLLIEGEVVRVAEALITGTAMQSLRPLCAHTCHQFKSILGTKPPCSPCVSKCLGFTVCSRAPEGSTLQCFNPLSLLLNPTIWMSWKSHHLQLSFVCQSQ